MITLDKEQIKRLHKKLPGATSGLDGRFLHFYNLSFFLIFYRFCHSAQARNIIVSDLAFFASINVKL